MKFAELREKLERNKGTLPWFIHPPLKNAEYPDDFLATGNPDDDSDNYDLLEYYEEAMPLIVAAVNALPELLQIAEAAEAYRVADDQSNETWEDEDLIAAARGKEALFAALEQGNE